MIQLDGSNTTGEIDAWVRVRMNKGRMRGPEKTPECYGSQSYDSQVASIFTNIIQELTH
jgi:hypothetical protein